MDGTVIGKKGESSSVQSGVGPFGRLRLLPGAIYDLRCLGGPGLGAELPTQRLSGRKLLRFDCYVVSTKFSTNLVCRLQNSLPNKGVWIEKTNLFLNLSLNFPRGIPSRNEWI